ncbi:MAG: DUF1330 domain-containing protein [Bosea sp. (in: a-proteobacteria)]
MSEAKGYWVARVDVDDEAAYAAYRSLNAIAFAKFGGRFIVRGPAIKVAKGNARKHNVVVEFPSLEVAQACYASPEYQAALKHLNQVGPVDLVIIGGYAGPQPGDA